jgi:ankyrin repeat protein
MMPFHRAAIYGHDELLKVLLEKDPDRTIVLERRNRQGATALLAAVASGQTNCVMTLLEAGANLLTVDKVRGER